MYRVDGLRTSGAGHNLADPVGCVEVPQWILRGEALVVVGVSVEDQVGALRIEDIPEWLAHIGSTIRGTEQGMVPVAQGAPCRVVGGIGLKPLPLRGGCATSSHL